MEDPLLKGFALAVAPKCLELVSNSLIRQFDNRVGYREGYPTLFASIVLNNLGVQLMPSELREHSLNISLETGCG